MYIYSGTPLENLPLLARSGLSSGVKTRKHPYGCRQLVCKQYTSIV